MTANQIFAPKQYDLPCTHESIIPGLDSIQCKSCRRTWPSWHPDFDRLLNQVAPTQKPVLEQEKIVLEQINLLSGKSVLEQEKIVLEQEKIVLEQEKIVLEQINLLSGKSALTQKQWLETYSPSTKRAYSYYRYVWMDKRKLSHLHIPGGNTKSAIASARATEIERWINLGRSPQKIQDLIKSWRKV